MLNRTELVKAVCLSVTTGIEGPGSDCPLGVNPELDWVEVLIRAGYTRE